MRKKRPWCLSWRVQADFSRRGTITSSSSSISTATEVSCEGQEYKIPTRLINTKFVFCVLIMKEQVQGSLWCSIGVSQAEVILSTSMGGLAQRPLFRTLRCSKLTSVSFTHFNIFIFVACFICISLISCNKVNMAMVFKLSNSS